MSRLLHQLVRDLVRDGEQYGPVEAANAVARLFGVYRAEAAAAEWPLLARARAFVEEHLGDPALTPASVASAHHVSVRTLQRRFHDAGLTVAAYIRHRRLERCRRELTDPAHATTTIGVLAARWGSGTRPS